MVMYANELTEIIYDREAKKRPNSKKMFNYLGHVFLSIFAVNLTLIMIYFVKSNLLSLSITSKVLMDYYYTSFNSISPKNYWILFAQSACYLTLSVSTVIAVFFALVRYFSSENR